MKGVLDSNKDIKKRMIFEVYTDGETDMEFFWRAGRSYCRFA